MNRSGYAIVALPALSLLHEFRTWDAVCRCQGAGCSFNPPACRIVGVGGSTPVWNEGFTFNYLDLLNPFDNDTYQSQL